MLVGGFSSLNVRGFCTAPPVWVSSETANAVLRLRVTVSTIASSRPASFCLSVRRTEVPTCSVTTSALAGDSTLICCWETTGTFLVDGEVRRTTTPGSSGGPVAVADQRGVHVERDLGDPAAGVGRQQQRGDQQGGSEPHDPACGHPQHDCSVHVAVPSYWSRSVSMDFVGRDPLRPDASSEAKLVRP